MRLLVVSEGEHELGTVDDPECCALCVLVRRLLPSSLELTLETRRIRDFRVRIHGKGSRLFKKLVWVLRQAERENFDAICVLIDQDRANDRRDAINNAQTTPLATIQRAIGLAVQTFDAWFLADQNALGQVLKNQVPRQPDPESQRDPKSQIQELMTTTGFQESQRRLYHMLAGIIDLDKLSHRCPTGFAPFAQRVRQLGHEAV